MIIKFGIIGLPNVGKSTFFNIITKLNVPSKNYPFCTIKPNIGIVNIFDIRLHLLKKIFISKNIISSKIEFVDIAGLVSGSNSGYGLGNKFLEDIRRVDAIIHVVRCFDDNNIIHVNNKIDPITDIKIVNTELSLYDIFLIKKKILFYKKNNFCKKKIFFLEKLFDYLNKTRLVFNFNFNKDEFLIIKSLNLITIKPIVYVANINKDNLDKNKHINIISNCMELKNSLFIKINMKNNKFLNSNNYFLSKNICLNSININSIIYFIFRKLRIHMYFTIGKKEISSWIINKLCFAIDASKCIHTDFKKGFIRVKVINFINFLLFRGEYLSKKNGKVIMKRRDYIVENGDILYFLFKI